MQKRKGFTLVELVIVIAVIAILAGVLIGTFASVLSKAQESARMQEMKAAEHDQKASDILNKLSNAEWFGWEDLETKIGEAVQQAVTAQLSENAKNNISNQKLEETKVAIINAVDQAIAKYAVAQGQENTQLTAEQVKYIVEQAVGKSGGVTEAQVKAIVTSAVNSIDTGIKPAQVQKIVDAAANKVIASGLTAADLAQALSGVAKDSDVDTIIAAVNNATKSVSTLTKDEIADIVSKYVNTQTGTAYGDFKWYTATATEYEVPATPDALVALSTVAQAGETFKGKTVTLQSLLTPQATAGNVNYSGTREIDLTGKKWIPIPVFEGTLDGQGVTVKGIDVEVVYWATEGSGSTGVAFARGTTSSGWYGERKAFGFIGVLAGTVKDLTLNYSTNYEDTQCVYTYFGGVAGAVQGKATIENVTVTGSIEGYSSIGGLVGTVFNYANVEKYDDMPTADREYFAELDLVLKNNEVTATIKSHTTTVHSAESKLIGEVQKYWVGKINLENNEYTGYFAQFDGGLAGSFADAIATKESARGTADRYVTLKSGVTAIELSKPTSSDNTMTVKDNTPASD